MPVQFWCAIFNRVSVLVLRCLQSQILQDSSVDSLLVRILQKPSSRGKVAKRPVACADIAKERFLLARMV
jgi:hypothetical protein